MKKNPLKEGSLWLYRKQLRTGTCRFLMAFQLMKEIGAAPHAAAKSGLSVKAMS